MLDMPILKFEKSTKYLDSQLDIQKNNKQLVLDIIANIGLVLNDSSTSEDDKEKYESVLDSANLFLQTITNNITSIEQLRLEINNITKELSELLAEKNKPVKTKEFYIAAFTNIKQTIVVYSKKMNQLENRLAIDNSDFNTFITENNIKFNYESVESNTESDSDVYKFTGFTLDNVSEETAVSSENYVGDQVEESEVDENQVDTVDNNEEIIEENEGTVEENDPEDTIEESETSSNIDSSDDKNVNESSNSEIEIDIDDLSDTILSEANVEDIVNDYELEIENERIDKLTNEFRNILVDMSNNEDEKTATKSAIAFFKEILPNSDSINFVDEETNNTEQSKSISELISGIVKESTNYSKKFVNNYPLYSGGLNLNSISSEFNVVPEEVEEEKEVKTYSPSSVIDTIKKPDYITMPNFEKNNVEKLDNIDTSIESNNLKTSYSELYNSYYDSSTFSDSNLEESFSSLESSFKEFDNILNTHANFNNIKHEKIIESTFEKNVEEQVEVEPEVIEENTEPELDVIENVIESESSIENSVIESESLVEGTNIIEPEPESNDIVESIEVEPEAVVDNIVKLEDLVENIEVKPEIINEPEPIVEENTIEPEIVVESDPIAENIEIGPDEIADNIIQLEDLVENIEFDPEIINEPVIEPEPIVEENTIEPEIVSEPVIENNNLSDNDILSDAELEDYLLNELLEGNGSIEETIVDTPVESNDTVSADVVSNNNSTSNLSDELLDDNVLEESLFEQDNAPLSIMESAEAEIYNATSPSFFKQKIERIEEGKYDNETLLISERTEKIYLPYKTSDLLNYIHSYPHLYNSLSDVVKQEFILPYTYFTEHPSKTRFSEAYNLIRNREGKNFISATLFAIKISRYHNLNPAIVASCKNREELELYIDCLNSNRLDKFKNFSIAYEVNPL